jgi:hypothetical protein
MKGLVIVQSKFGYGAQGANRYYLNFLLTAQN